MESKSGIFEKIAPYKKYIALVLGCILSMFSIGRFNMTLFIFFWPFLYLYFIHNESKLYISIPGVCLANIFANMVKWSGFSGIDKGTDVGWGVYWGVVGMLPYVIECLTYGRIAKWRSVILFPLAVASIEFIFAFVPKSNNNKMAYGLFGNLILMQSVSLFGVYFLSFFLALFNSIFEYALNLYLKEKTISKWIWWYLAGFIFLEIYGGIYSLVLPSFYKVTVLSVPGISQFGYINKDADQGYKGMEAYLQIVSDTIDKAEYVGAGIVLFAEEAFLEFKSLSPTFIKEVAALCKDRVHVSLSLDLFNEDLTEFYNENSLISAYEGEVYHYTKHHLVPKTEKDYKKGTDNIKVVELYDPTMEMTYKVTTVICYDLNFDWYMNWVGFKHPAIVLAPSWDYDKVLEFQSYMTRVRAIENGFSIVKNTVAGITIYTDFNGRTINYYKVDGEDDDYFSLGSVNMEGRTPLYSYIGIFWNYFYIIGLILVIFLKSDILNPNAPKDESTARNEEDSKKNLVTPVKANEIEPEKVEAKSSENVPLQEAKNGENANLVPESPH